LRVVDKAGASREIETIIDTGFTGSLTLPPTWIQELGLPHRSRSSAVLANGNFEVFDVYAGTVIWDGHTRPILIQAINNAPLLGMNLLADHDLRIRVTAGGVVEIAAVA
jgi:clan AA aspartic protease